MPFKWLNTQLFFLFFIDSQWINLHSLEIVWNTAYRIPEPISNDWSNQKPVGVCKRILSINPVRIKNYFLFCLMLSIVCVMKFEIPSIIFPFRFNKIGKKNPTSQPRITELFRTNRNISLFLFFAYQKKCFFYSLQFETEQKKKFKSFKIF